MTKKETIMIVGLLILVALIIKSEFFTKKWKRVKIDKTSILNTCARDVGYGRSCEVYLKNDSNVIYNLDLFSNDSILKNYSLCHYLQAGDSLFKEENSDTIFVYRHNTPTIWIIK